SLYCLIESKDEADAVNIAPISKLRNQLLRRPAGTIGFVFSSSAFTEAALELVNFTLPQAILLWTGDEVEKALVEGKICDYAEQKFRICVDEGMPDYNIAVH